VGHDEAVAVVADAGGARVAIDDLENDEDAPVYVHAKVCVVDDVWAMVGRTT
jgi:phosphatidylserine/phosphatidylglycerophosphate/cardiolipin synthase-like enzyme